MSSSTHGNEYCQEVKPESEAGKPAEVSQRANLRQEEPHYDEDQGTDDVTESVFRDFRDILPKQDGDLA